MQYFTKFFIFFILVNTSLVLGVNTLSKAVVKNGELLLSFSQKFNKKEVRHVTRYNPYREIYDFKNTILGSNRVPLGLGAYVTMTQNSPKIVRVTISKCNKYNARSYQSPLSKESFHISLPQKEYKAKIVLNHRVVVIDAGHGGHDTGAIVGRKYEKDVVLAIAKKTAKALKNLGYTVYLTRKKNRFLTLSQRTQIADKKNAMAFISIHANSSSKKKVNGVETYSLQSTRDAKSQRIAIRENSAVLKGAVTRLSKKMIVDALLNGPKLFESEKLAIDVQKRIMTNLKKKYSKVLGRGVRKAPFYVLVGASRPSILVETGYMTNKKEKKRLFTAKYQRLIAKGIAEGVDHYLTLRCCALGL